MATNITEEASRLRASAASLIIQNELDLKDIERQVAGFKIESTSSEELTDRELKILLAIGEKVAKLLQQASSDLPIACSAIAASLNPTDMAGKITSIINQLDIAKGHFVEAEVGLLKYKDASDEFNKEKEFSERKGILVSAVKGINVILVELRNVLSELHLLVFENKYE